MRIKVSPAEVAVGAFVLVGAFGLLALFVLSGGHAGLRGTRVELACTFNRVEGVGVGTPVEMNGLEIGVVKDVGLNHRGRVLTVLSIDRQHVDKIRQNETARELAAADRDAAPKELERLRAAGTSLVGLRTSMLTGDSVVVIDHGDPASRAVEPGELLVAVPVRAAMDDAVDMVKDAVRTVLGSDEGPAAGSLAALLRDEGRLYAHVESILAGIDVALEADGGGTLGQLLHDRGMTLDQAVSLMRTTENSLRVLVERSAALMETNRRLESVLRTIDERGALAVLDGPEDELVARLGAILTELNGVATDVKRFTEVLPTLAEDSEDFLAETRRTVGATGDVVEASKRHWLIEGLFEPSEDAWLRAHDLGPMVP